jgi:hypothetical protein
LPGRKQTLDQDIARSVPVTLENWRGGPDGKLAERFAALRSQL